MNLHRPHATSAVSALCLVGAVGANIFTLNWREHFIAYAAASVVTLDDIAKALSGIERPSMRLAAIGYDFTEEARAQISSLGGLIFAEQNVWGWTER
jgi:hypothetical protein